jgi:outer membrane protein TolC
MAMTEATKTSFQDPLTERIERLLRHYETTKQTVVSLKIQVETLMAERDALTQRLTNASHRLEVLIDRIPPSIGLDPDIAGSDL